MLEEFISRIDPLIIIGEGCFQFWLVHEDRELVWDDLYTSDQPDKGLITGKFEGVDDAFMIMARDGSAVMQLLGLYARSRMELGLRLPVIEVVLWFEDRKLESYMVWPDEYKAFCL